MPNHQDNQYSPDEAAQRREAIVRAMVNMPPDPRTAKRPAKPRGKAIEAASDQSEASGDDTPNVQPASP